MSNGYSDDALSTVLVTHSVLDFCDFVDDTDRFLDYLYMVRDEASLPDAMPLSLRMMKEQLKGAILDLLSRPFGNYLLRRLFYNCPNWAHHFADIIRELSQCEELVYLCCSHNYLLFLTLLKHSSRRLKPELLALAENIVKRAHIPSLITSKDGGIWVLESIVESFPALHGHVATVLKLYPKKYLSSMAIDVVSHIFEGSPTDLNVIDLARNFYRMSRRLKEKNFQRVTFAIDSILSEASTAEESE